MGKPASGTRGGVPSSMIGFPGLKSIGADFHDIEFDEAATRNEKSIHQLADYRRHLKDD
jgi:hypothetical protein